MHKMLVISAGAFAGAVIAAAVVGAAAMCVMFRLRKTRSLREGMLLCVGFLLLAAIIASGTGSESSFWLVVLAFVLSVIADARSWQSVLQRCTRARRPP